MTKKRVLVVGEQLIPIRFELSHSIQKADHARARQADSNASARRRDHVLQQVREFDPFFLRIGVQKRCLQNIAEKKPRVGKK